MSTTVKQTRLPYPIKMNEQQMLFVDQKINELVKNKCVVQTHRFDPSGFLSNIFLVPKKEQNSFRMILNLKQLNTFMETPHFKMESIKDVQRLVGEQFWIGHAI